MSAEYYEEYNFEILYRLTILFQNVEQRFSWSKAQLCIAFYPWVTSRGNS